MKHYSKSHLFNEIATSAFRLLSITFHTLTLAAVLWTALTSEAKADYYTGDTCESGKIACGTSCVKSGDTCYAYDDYGRVTEIVTFNEHGIWDNDSNASTRTILNYDSDGNLTGGLQYSKSAYTSYTNLSVVRTDEGILLYPSSSGGGYSLVIDDGKIVRDGFRWRVGAHLEFGYDDVKSYSYDYPGRKRSQTLLSCSNRTDDISGLISSNCQDTEIVKYYDYDYDALGNVISEKIDNEVVASSNYSDGYYVKNDLACSNYKSCTACSKWSDLKNGICNPNWEWEFDEDSKTLYIDENMPNFTTDFLGLSTMTIDKIVCRGDVEKCRKVMAKYPLYYPGGSYGADPYGYSSPIGGGYQPTDLSNLVFPANESTCESGRYYWSGSSCNNKSGGINCEENFKQMETWCNRIRYTPAEAAKVLKNDDNEIIMTFKVNR